MEVVRDDADGVILAEWSGPRYVREVRQAIGPDRRLTVFVTATPDEHGLEAAVRALDLETKLRDQTAPYAGHERADLVHELGLVVSRPGWRDRLGAWHEAGADAVVLTPLGSDPPSVAAALLSP
jgi:alkanesulfonate monooxygenase SsuD/methylene tetrahydromethanopterin reductase-like flavin-dependent oxidoreductase (luciferase family)